MAETFFDKIYKNKTLHTPDVLSCLANLSNDEVFTPPDVVNKMLDLLPQELFSDPNATFLDPACKTGVFLREIAKRLLAGLADKMPNLQERIDHIFHKQLYGIAITELTSLLSRRSLYCSKYPNGEYSISHFDTAEGNIRYRRINHVFSNGKCKYCGASEAQWKRGEEKETHAYEFIHTLTPEKIFNMKFDVIISNPPYQLSDGGSANGMSAKPIYQHFIEMAKKLRPRYITMIIPSRWFSGGKGLDSFRDEMLNDTSIRVLCDYENFKDVFPGVDLAGGACYFLWDRDNKGICKVRNYIGKEYSESYRYLNRFDTFIRSNISIEIVEKITSKYEKFLNERVSIRLPFGIPTTYQPLNSGVPCYFTQKIGLKYVDKDDVKDGLNVVGKWKFLVPKAPIAGQTDFSKPVGFYYDGNTRIAKPGEICSESWLIAGAFDSEEETLYFKSYILTKTVRFLLLQTVVSQNITRKNFCFVPELEHYTQIYSDAYLRKLWDINDDEWSLIKSKIGEIGGEE